MVKTGMPLEAINQKSKITRLLYSCIMLLPTKSENAIRNPCSGIPDADWHGYKLIVSYEHIFHE